MALKNDGTMIAWGDNSAGQTGTLVDAQVKLFAAGRDHTLVAVFSPLVEYPVDVSKDLLLIYNANSTNSIFVKDYYLAHRPMVGGANVLGISCATDERIDVATFTNQILTPVRSWLAANPTKRPQYAILFPDIPTRVWTMTNGQYWEQQHSVAFGLSTNAPGIQPFITSINMGFWDLTNDCIAYINKLERFGTNYSPGKLLISGGGAAYGNTNFVLDDIRHGAGYYITNGDWDYSLFGYVVSDATNALLAAGVPQASILFYDGTETLTNGIPYNMNHPTGRTNVVGYMCWGAHSSLTNGYPRDGNVVWGGSSSWWVIETTESYNGQRFGGQGNFTQWFSDIAFGGTNYENSPIAAVSHTDEPGLAHVNDASFISACGQAESHSVSALGIQRRTQYFQAVGDPLIKK